jgi:hypothetical protein
MALSMLFLSKNSLLPLVLLYAIGAVFLLKLFLSKKAGLIKTFAFSFLILLPLLHFLLFESFLGGQAFTLNWDIFLLSVKFAIAPSFVVSLIIAIINLFKK